MGECELDDYGGAEEIGKGRSRYLRDDEVAVIERCVVKIYEHVVVTKFRYLGFLGELEAFEAIFACDVPLLGC